MDVNCKRCGKKYHRPVSVLRNGRGKYCSNKCRYEAATHSVTVKCAVCAARVVRMQSQLARTNASVCSLKCQYVWRGLRAAPSRRNHTPPDAVALFDKIDRPMLEQTGWRSNEHGYAIQGAMPRQPMHRIVMEAMLGRSLRRGELVDHINRVTNDNRRCNLRLVSYRENAFNRSTNKNNTTGYSGVSMSDDKWRAYITYERTRISLGRYTDKIEAAYVRDQVAIQLYGEHARLNVL